MKHDRIEIYESRKVKGQYGWRYIAKNGRKIATSGELYHNRAHAAKMVQKLFGHLGTTVVWPELAKNAGPKKKRVTKRITNPVR